MNEIIPFFTTINAKPGVKVTQRVVDYVGVIDVSLDSDYIIAAVSKAISTSELTNKDKANLQKITEIFKAMGLDNSGNVPITTPVNDSETLSIRYSQTTAVLSSNLIIRFAILTNTNDTAVEQIVTISRGTQSQQVLLSLQKIIARNKSSLKYLRKLYRVDDNTINVGWFPTYEKFKFKFTILSVDEVDGCEITFISKK